MELFLPTPAHIYDTPILLDVVKVNVPALLGLDILDGNNLLVDNVTGNLWNRTITNKNSLQYEDKWKIKLIRYG